jgi:ATP-dependent exoDNAse (exonuclease V) beta subunit
MSNLVNKIISASAGTGKTYRLSLEYLALLLKFYHNPDFQPDQILVITFTRKATAEIRDRIFMHLDTLSNHKKGWQDLAINLKQLTDISAVCDKDNPLSEAETETLTKAYYHLITHKDELQVMTIDSYIHSIFRNLIRPVRGIDRFELDLKAVDKRMPFLFNEIMTPVLLKRIQSLLSRRLKPSLDEFKSFFRSLIDNRWIYYLAHKRTINAEPDTLAFYTMHPELWKAKTDEYYRNFKEVFCQIIHNFDDYAKVTHNKVTCAELTEAKLLNRDFMQLFAPLPENFKTLADEMDTYLKDEWTLLRLLKLLSDEKYLWNGTRVRSSKTFTCLDDWKLLHQEALQHLSDFLVFHLFLPEQVEILDIWQDVLLHYDKLIYRYKNFTYDDIAWFTFEGLYSSEPPLFEAEPESIANAFYEFMCRRTRFMLIDEFQDTSILQFNILAPMIEELIAGEGSKPYGGLIVVGDEKQSIFGWRGGQRDLLLNLDEIFVSLQAHERDNLTNSWRSSPSLMNFINGIFGHKLLQDSLAAMQAEWQYADITGQKKELEAETVVQFKLKNYEPRSADNKIDKAMRSFIEEMVIPALPAADEPYRSIAILARKNDELEMIRTLLAEHNITSEFQSSKSLLEQPMLKAMLFLLRFAVYHDWYDFLAFLRSDLILMDGTQLKQVINTISAYQQDSSETKTAINFTEIPVAQAALELANQIDTSGIYKSCLLFLQTCQVQFKLALDRDYVNIQRFLDIALDYEQNYQSELPELQGFLRFCEDNGSQEIFSQQDVENSQAIQLLSIHKSKGLEFDSVFVWWNLKGSNSREESKLSSWVHYSDKSYHNLSDIALSLHYNKVLEASAYSNIMDADEKREQLEELNNLYVALTRAKSRLYLHVAFEKKGCWEDYWSNYVEKDKLTPPHYAIAAALDYMMEHAVKQSDETWLIGNAGSVCKEADANVCLPEQINCSQVIDLTHILPDWQNPVRVLLPNAEINPDQNWKNSYLYDRANLKGNIAHYYLAQIRYATQEEIQTAKVLTLRQFGNLMTLADLNGLIDILEAQLPELKDIFKPQYDLIYNEYSIYQYNHEYRIDRLMINTATKTYRIIDYKTGGIYQDEQLDKYNLILRNSLLPKDYKIEKEPEYIVIRL